MKLYVCAVHDVKAGAFSNPQCFRSIGEAIRSFTDACQNEGSNFNRHATDYAFYRLGVFNDENGEITSDVVKLIEAAQCLAIKPVN